MMVFLTANDLITMFVGLEVLSLPLYVMTGLARRRRLLSQEAALKYFLLGAFSSAFFLFGSALLYGYAGSSDLGPSPEAITTTVGRPRRPAPPRCRARPRRPALQGRRGALPLVDARRLPGRADPGHRLHGRVHQARRVRRDPALHLRRRRCRTGGTGRAPSYVVAVADDGRRCGALGDPDRRQAPPRLLLDRARRASSSSGCSPSRRRPSAA